MSFVVRFRFELFEGKKSKNLIPKGVYFMQNIKLKKKTLWIFKNNSCISILLFFLRHYCRLNILVVYMKRKFEVVDNNSLTF